MIVGIAGEVVVRAVSSGSKMSLQTRIRRLMDGSPAQADAERAAESLRRLARWLVSHDASDSGVGTLAAGLASVEDSLAHHDTRSRFSGPGARSDLAAKGSDSFHPNRRSTHPLLGRANPVAPPIALRVEGDHVVGDLVFDAAHEGIPGCAHGGYIAAGFDIVLLQAATRSPLGGGVTGTLEIRYVGLTPTDAPLCYEARLDRTEGRKIYAEGWLRTNPPQGGGAESRVTARAFGVFVAAAPEGGGS